MLDYTVFPVLVRAMDFTLYWLSNLVGMLQTPPELVRDTGRAIHPILSILLNQVAESYLRVPGTTDGHVNSIPHTVIID